jgi:predicted nucleic acid-binding protein
MRVVLDTNVLIAAFIAHGACPKCWSTASLTTTL